MCSALVPIAHSEPPALEVNIDGILGDIKSKVMAGLAIYQESQKDEIDKPQLRILHRRAPQQIKTILQSFGYYRVEVSGDLRRTRGRWVASYVVTLGPPLRYQNVTLEITGEGKQETELQALIDNFPIKQDSVVDHGQYETAKETLLRVALERGYLDTSLTRREVRVDIEKYQAQLSLSLDTGPLFYFGELNIEQETLDSDFVKRYINIEPGTRYSAAKIITAETALRNSGYFLETSVRPMIKDAQNNRVPIRIALEPVKASRYLFGLGYGTDTGARAKAEWERRRINRRGHRLVSGLTLSEVRPELSVRYLIPFRNVQTDRLSLFASYSDDDPDTSDSELARAGISRLTVHGRTRIEYLLAYQYEAYTVADETDTVDFLTPGVKVSWISADDPIFPSKGLRIELDLTVSQEGVLSDFSFAQARLSGKWLRPLWETGRVILRGEAGYTLASEVTGLPASVRFFTGGDRSVRGFKFKSLGSVNDDGEVIGGRHLLVGSAEYEHRILPQWSVAAFVDAGNAFDNFDDPLENGAGIGVRWRSPVGPVRLDFASATSEPDNPWRVHFSIGPDL